MADFRRSVSITIPSIVNENGATHYVVIANVVNSTIDHTTVNRRFSQFNDLYNSFVKKFGSNNVPDFPAKTYFWSSTDSPEFIEKRRKELETFLIKCCANPSLQNSTEMIDFLRLNPNWQVGTYVPTQPKHSLGFGKYKVDDSPMESLETFLASDSDQNANLAVSSNEYQYDGQPNYHEAQQYEEEIERETPIQYHEQQQQQEQYGQAQVYGQQYEQYEQQEQTQEYGQETPVQYSATESNVQEHDPLSMIHATEEADQE